MKVHVQRICQTSFYQLRQLRSVHRSLSVDACTAFAHAFGTSRLDYCNSLLAGIGDGSIDQLQTVLRVSARLVLRKRKFDLISAGIRDRLHWLPIRSRIDFKLGLLVYKCLHGTSPAYLTKMFVQKSTVPALSPLPSSLDGARWPSCAENKNKNNWATKLRHFWARSLEQSTWRFEGSSLSLTSLTVFKQSLKAYLFKQCWCAIQPKLKFAATFLLWEASLLMKYNLYITLHYITLHYITLHYITLHYITLHYITLHYITLHYITLHYITLHYITLHYITLHYITLHYITLHYITLRYVTLHYITLRYITLHYITLHYITSQN